MPWPFINCRIMTVLLPALTPALIACRECDLLQHEIALSSYGTALCARCDAPLFRMTPHGLHYTLVSLLTGILFFTLANTYPLVQLEVKGNLTTATLFGAVQSLISQDLLSVAALVLITTILAPACEMIALLYLLIPLKCGIVAPAFPLVFRFVEHVRPWGMIEVLMLGILVAIVKLSTFATVIPGIALYSSGALMLALSAATYFYNPRDVWHAVAGYA